MQQGKRGVSRDESGLEERKSEATTDETLADLEDSEKLSGSNTSKSDQPVPSPDGQGSESRNDRSDGSDRSGPM
ncbi:MAG TPA: hypothetical protein VIV66_18495 [Pyrinomonadaceae bacterium]